LKIANRIQVRPDQQVNKVVHADATEKKADALSFFQSELSYVVVGCHNPFK
jgi:hypothetical protein